METIKSLTECHLNAPYKEFLNPYVRSYINSLVGFYSNEFRYIFTSGAKIEEDVKYTENRLEKDILRILEAFDTEIKLLNFRIEVLQKKVENPELTDIRTLSELSIDQLSYEDYEEKMDKESFEKEMFTNRLEASGLLELDKEDLEAIKQRNISWITKNIKEGQDFSQEERTMLLKGLRSWSLDH